MISTLAVKEKEQLRYLLGHPHYSSIEGLLLNILVAVVSIPKMDVVLK